MAEMITLGHRRYQLLYSKATHNTWFTPSGTGQVARSYALLVSYRWRRICTSQRWRRHSKVVGPLQIKDDVHVHGGDSVSSHFVNFHFVNSHFVNSHLVNIDQMGIDKVGIDKVRS